MCLISLVSGWFQEEVEPERVGYPDDLVPSTHKKEHIKKERRGPAVPGIHTRPTQQKMAIQQRAIRKGGGARGEG